MTAPDPVGPGRGVTSVSRYSLLLNYLPMVQLAVGAFVVGVGFETLASRVVVAGLWVFALPPLVSRLTVRGFGLPSGRDLEQDSHAYKVWWFLSQWQALFNRFPAIEEGMRLVPGLYPLWIRCWGGRVSPYVFWSPGSFILDRNLVEVEAGVVVGLQAGLAGHTARLDPDGVPRVDLGPAVVERGALLGARSGLMAGSRVRAGRMLPAGKILRPYESWPPETGGSPEVDDA